MSIDTFFQSSGPRRTDLSPERVKGPNPALSYMPRGGVALIEVPNTDISQLTINRKPRVESVEISGPGEFVRYCIYIKQMTMVTV